MNHNLNALYHIQPCKIWFIQSVPDNLNLQGKEKNSLSRQEFDFRKIVKGSSYQDLTNVKLWSFSCFLVFEYQLISNSLIILNKKTIKITTVMVVWISVTNYHKILQNLSLNFCKNYCSFGKLYQKLHLRSVSSISRHLKVGLKKHGSASYFSPLLGVWISDETLHVAFLCIT